MRNALNIYKRKDGRFEGRIPFGRNDNGSLKYRYFYSKDLAELKDKMLSAYTSIEKYNALKLFRKFVQNGFLVRSFV